MKKIASLIGLITAFFLQSQAQTVKATARQRMTNTVCNCLSKVDLTKITNKEEAVAAITDCFAKRPDLIAEVAEEKKVDMTDQAAMREIGIDIGKDLLKENCSAFVKISSKMAQIKMAQSSDQGYSEGKFSRIDVKGFNYLILQDAAGSEKSFLWLRQFTGSEKIIDSTTSLTGKKIKVKFQELEVYLPQAKGYYKVKEITAVDIL
jgi:hypothetical protein